MKASQEQLWNGVGKAATKARRSECGRYAGLAVISESGGGAGTFTRPGYVVSRQRLPASAGGRHAGGRGCPEWPITPRRAVLRIARSCRSFRGGSGAKLPIK